MRQRATRVRLHLVFCTAVLSVGSVLCQADALLIQTRRPAPPDFVRPLLDSYEQGDHDGALRMLDQVWALPDTVTLIQATDPRKPPREAAEPPFTLFAGVFTNVAQDWLREAPAEKRAGRFLRTAVAVLDVEDYRRLRGGSDRFLSVVEWICQELRRSEPTPFEHLWHLGAIALGVGDEHLSHAAGRFPKEARFALAQAMTEQATRIAMNRAGISPVQLVRRIDVLTDRAALSLLATTLAGLDALADEPSVGFEGRLRAGIIRFHLSRFQDSLRDLSAASGSPDPFIRALAHLYRGLTFDHLHQASDALSAYQAAYDAFPAGQSAALRLAAALFLEGRRDEATEIASRATRYPATGDPWNMYGWGDYRFWDGYRTRLRAMVDR